MPDSTPKNGKEHRGKTSPAAVAVIDDGDGGVEAASGSHSSVQVVNEKEPDAYGLAPYYYHPNLLLQSTY